MWMEEECMYDIFATYGISHWWFKRQKFYIDRHSAETNRRAIVRTHMRILSVVRIEVFSIYGYDYMKQIVLLDKQCFYLTKATLRDALQLPQDNNNFTPPPNANTIISFVNELGYPNVVRTLSGVVANDMYQPWRALATIINLYQTQLNLTKPRWEATGLEFIHDYKILDSL
ncbi:hypothetical protein Tco_0562165 [Tanacetum coccineum]